MFLSSKTTPPRIEADIIDYLIIDEMEVGTVTTPATSSTPYASIGSVKLHNTYTWRTQSNEVLPPAEIYCQDFDAVEITCSHGGVLEIPELAPSQRILIHRGLFNGSEILDSDCNIVSNAPEAPDSESQIGIIRLATSSSLSGQIVLNRAGNIDPNVAWHCTGPVKNLTDEISLSAAPSTNDIDTMPEYTRTSGTLGGGAVGLAPFYLYDEDCLPINDDAAPTITIREFDRTNPLATPRSVKLRFYGPVRANHATESPVKLTLLRFANGHWHESPISPSRFTVNIKRTTDPGFSREVEIHGNGTWKFPAGWYKVEPVNTGAAALRSDLVDSQPLVRDFEYYFELMPETASAGYDLGGCGCPADFNQDGGVDGSDVEAFLIAWEIGETDGDVNCDGGVDGSDVETFFYYWEAGGCD